MGKGLPDGGRGVNAKILIMDEPTAEVDLLRSELDMLKRAFRRHCLETA